MQMTRMMTLMTATTAATTMRWVLVGLGLERRRCCRQLERAGRVPGGVQARFKAQTLLWSAS